MVGKAILSDQYQIVPKKPNYYKNEVPNRFSASSISSEISLLSLGTEIKIQENEESEEILASDGIYIDEDRNFQLMEGVSLNEKFTQDPKKYFQDKLMTAIFRKVWSKLSKKLDVVANLHAGKPRSKFF